MILRHEILYKLQIYLYLSNDKIRRNGDMYEGYNAPMKEVQNINFNASPDWINEKTFRSKELWESKHVLMKAIYSSTKIRDMCRFVGLINYYRDMWHKRVHTLYPLTKLFYTKVKFKQIDVEQNAFTETNKTIGRDIIISYTNLSEEFTNPIDATKIYCGSNDSKQ